MRYSTAEGTDFEIVGASRVEDDGSGGVRPLRLPAAAAAQVPTASMRLMTETAAGVRLRFTTAATRIVVHLEVAPVQLAGMREPCAAALDLVVDGAVAGMQRIEGGGSARIDGATDELTTVPGRPVAVSFEGLAPGEKRIEVWFPHTATVRFLGLETDRPVHRSSDGRAPTWIHHGSSISHCLEAARPTRAWPAAAALQLGWELQNMSFAGNALLDQFVARAIRDAPAEVITLKLGINVVNADAMRMRSFVPAVHGFLDTIRDGHPDAPIVVISPISCPAVESRPGPTTIDPLTGTVVSLAPVPSPAGALTLRRIRRVLAAVVESRARADPRLHHIDGRELFDEADIADGRMPDGLHPDEEGYGRIAERFVERVRSIPIR